MGSSNIFPDSPKTDLQAHEAALQATWLGAFHEAMTTKTHNPWSHSHFAWLGHMRVSATTCVWTPSQLLIFNVQQFILGAEREKHNPMTP